MQYFFSFLLKQKFCHLFLSIIRVTEIYTNFCLAQKHLRLLVIHKSLYFILYSSLW